MMEDLYNDYEDLKARYDKLCAFLERVEDGSSPIHDDYPVAELYEQKAVMEQEMQTLQAKLKRRGYDV